VYATVRRDAKSRERVQVGVGGESFQPDSYFRYGELSRVGGKARSPDEVAVSYLKTKLASSIEEVQKGIGRHCPWVG
jgi:hypothetical protein